MLGHGDMHNQLTPKIVESLTDQRIAFITAGCAVIVRRISLSGLSSYCSRHSWAPGTSHSMVLTNSGEVWSFGNSEDGQLGSGEAGNQLLPVPVRITTTGGIVSQNIKIRYISAGGSHSMIMTTCNSTGSASVPADSSGSYSTSAVDTQHHDQASRGIHGSAETRRTVEEGVQLPTWGQRQCLPMRTLRTRGQLFTAGNGVGGRLGHGNEVDQHSFKEVVMYD